MAINNNKHDYMGAVSTVAEEWRSRSFEACMNGFMKSMICQATAVDVPKGIDLDAKERIVESVKTTIENSSKEFTKSAFDTENEHGKLFDVDLAHEIVSPSSLNESVQQLLAQHIYDESKDRAELLAAEFDAGSINNLTEVQTLEHIRNMYAEEMFDERFDNGTSFKSGMQQLLSTEGEIVVDEIKEDVSNLVNETEAKNSVIREAVAEINKKKADIEEKINGKAESHTDNAAKEGDHNDPDSENSSSGPDSDDGADSGDDSGSDADMGAAADGESDDGEETSFEEAAEGWNVNALKKIKKGKLNYTKYSFYTVKNDNLIKAGVSAHSNEAYNIDRNTFSREAAEQILDQFRELEDGININSGDSEYAQSVSDDKPNYVNDNDPDAESSENDYSDDENNEIQVDNSAFEYKEETPDTLEGDDNSNSDETSEEAMARDFMPLSLSKINGIKVKANRRLPVFLALQKDRGQEFFDTIAGRHQVLLDMMSREDIDPSLTTDETAKALEKVFKLSTQVKKDTETILEDLGILGILDNKYQRTDSHVDNALLSLFNANLIAPMGKPDAGKDLSVSTEELYESELANIFKLAVKKADLTMDIADSHGGLNIVEKKDELGYIDEIINEKMFSVVKPEDVSKVEEKVKTLFSLECMIPIEEVANIQAFVTKSNPTDEKPKILLDTLKDIDGYGFSFIDEITKIKSSIKNKFKNNSEKAANGNPMVNFDFDTDKLVDLVVEQQDTTKIDANMFEQVLSKLCENKSITSSTEALILRNKAKAIATSYITAEKLGFLREEDIQAFENYVF